jgi:hypothetical protein
MAGADDAQVTVGKFMQALVQERFDDARSLLHDEFVVYEAVGVTELRRDASRDLNGKTGLAGAAGIGQRHQPVVDEQLFQVSHLCAAADEAGELRRKVLRDNGVGCAQGREIITNIGMA